MTDEPATNDPPPPRAGSLEPSSGPPPQFSLGEFLLWIAIVSIGLSGLAWIAPQIFAGICGFIALAALIVTVIWNPRAPLFQIVWYALLFMYMISIVIAILAPPHPAH